MKSVFFRMGWVCVALIVSAALAMADGEVRPATSVEKSYVLRVLKGFDASMPKGPDGWTETSRTEVEAPDQMGIGAAMGPMHVDYRVKWEDQATQAAARERMIDESLSIPVPDQSAIEEMNTEMESLSRKMMEAAQKGDMATVEKLRKEADALGEKNKKLFAATDARMREIQGNASTDVEVEIQFVANHFEEMLHEAVRQAPVSGLIVYRVEEKDDEGEPRPGTSYVFLGDWQTRDQGEYLQIRAEARADMPPASVQTIMVSVRGDDARARQMLEAIDWDSLKGLLGK